MLHTVNKSPFERANLEACLKRASKGSAILLLEDGVYGAITGTAKSCLIAEAVKSHEVYALGPDLAARGLDPASLIAGVRVVDYAGFVDLSIEKGTVQSWL